MNQTSFVQFIKLRNLILNMSARLIEKSRFTYIDFDKIEKLGSFNLCNITA